MIAKKLLFTGIAAIFSIGGLAASTTAASAYVVCNRDGDCWHTERRIHQPGMVLEYHPDDWYFHRTWEGDRDHHYRDYHGGRGFYRGGVWITL